MFKSRLSEISKDKITNLPDEEIFAGSLKNPSLFEVILDRYQDAFLRKAEKFVKSPDIAEDVVQETFIKIYRRGATFTEAGEGSFRAWAYKVLTNTAITYYQSQRKRETVPLSPELSELIPDEGEVRSGIGRETADYITSVLNKMPSHFSQILKKFFLNGQSQEEIADESGLSVAAVKVRIYRAKESFRSVAATMK